MYKTLLALLLTIPITASAVEFNSAFGIKFEEPYKGMTNNGEKMQVSPEIRDDSIFDNYSIQLDENNLVRGIFAEGLAHSKRKSCLDSIYTLASKFEQKYKDSFKREIGYDIAYFKSDKYVVYFMCFENNVMFSARINKKTKHLNWFYKWTMITSN